MHTQPDIHKKYKLKNVKYIDPNIITLFLSHEVPSYALANQVPL